MKRVCANPLCMVVFVPRELTDGGQPQKYCSIKCREKVEYRRRLPRRTKQGVAR